MSDINITERQAGDVTVLDLDGKVTIGEGSVALRTAIRRLLGEGKNKILLNLAGVGYIDSSGIGELVSSFTAVKKEGGTLKLLNLTQKIQDLLAITKLLTVFDVFDDEGEALALERAREREGVRPEEGQRKRALLQIGRAQEQAGQGPEQA